MNDINKIKDLEDRILFLENEHQQIIHNLCDKSDYKWWALTTTLFAVFFAILFIIEKFF